jgi:hypothetical protein
MQRSFFLGLVLASAVLGWTSIVPAYAADPAARSVRAASATGAHQTTAYRKKARPQVRGYAVRRGGYYSYQAADSINTYGDARSLYGSTGYFRDFNRDRQSMSGPFDHGFFFDSGTHPRGGDSPYMH